MPVRKSRSPQNEPWESGWDPDSTRVPGTRRLWLAGALAVATVVTCVTVISLTDQQTDTTSTTKKEAQTADPTGPGLISYASASTSGAATPGSPDPGGKSGTPSTRPTVTTAPDPHGSASAPPARATKSPAPPASSPASTPSSTWRSIRSANFPDRYWHLSSGLVKLDPARGSESREDSTFELVRGLADGSCYSFATGDGRYLRHRDFVLRADRSDGSTLFKRDATFCARTSSVSGAIMLESVNYPGRFLRHKDFTVRLDPYQYSSLYQADSAFRLVGGLA